MFYCHEHKFMVFMFSHLNFRLGMPVCWRAANSKQTLGLFRCESDCHALPQLKQIKETEKWLGSEQWYFLFFFIFILFILFFQWFLSYIDMNQPWIYMCSPSRCPLSPPSPPDPSGSSQGNDTFIGIYRARCSCLALFLSCIWWEDASLGDHGWRRLHPQ